MDNQDSSQSGQYSGGSDNEDVQIDLAWSTEESSQVSADDLVAVGYQPEPGSDGQYNS